MATIAYIIYLFLTYIITVHVGLRFFRHGRVFILRLFHGDEKLTDFVNRVLLVGYYLLNLGYAAWTIQGWRPADSLPDLMAGIGIRTGRILLTLAVMHYGNMAVIAWIGAHHHIVNNKT
jgi:hypothetical protein